MWILIEAIQQHYYYKYYLYHQIGQLKYTYSTVLLDCNFITGKFTKIGFIRVHVGYSITHAISFNAFFHQEQHVFLVLMHIA